MKPRAVLLSIVLSAVAACSLGGGLVTLGSGHPNPLAAAGTDTGGGGGGGGDGVAGNGAAGSLNVGDADTLPVPCPNGMKTTISGTVWDPAGKVQLYNAVVYIPEEGATPIFEDRVACEKCTDPVPAIAYALSGPDGSFTLDQDVPNTTHVSLVVQLGKWFRQTTVPITPCQPNALSDRNYTRLPQHKNDGDLSHIPKIAMSTGHSDALECLLRKIGIDDSEFTTDAHDGRVNMFVGCIGDAGRYGTNKFMTGEAFPSTNKLFDPDPGTLNDYDVVIFSCEGHKCADTGDSPTPIQTPTHLRQLADFANHGGRVFLDHEHYNWLNHSPDKIKSAAQFDHSDPIASPLPTQINTLFPKGNDFAEWLVNVSASTTPGILDITSGQLSASSIDPNRAQSWIFHSAPDDFVYFTIGTPVALLDNTPAPEACGRVVFTDLHVSKSGGGTSDDKSDQDSPFPTGCNKNPLSGQEKALEFMLFDLSSCVQKETAKPTIVVK
jgi:hypothetical protein